MALTLQEAMGAYIAREAHVRAYKSFAGPDSFELLLVREPPLRLKTDREPSPIPKPFAKLLVARPVDRNGDHFTSALTHCHLLGPDDRRIGPPFGFRTALDEPLVSQELIDAIIKLRGKRTDKL